MFTVADYDPVFVEKARHTHPQLWPNHRRLVQLADAEDRRRLAELDAELDLRCAERLTLLARLTRSRDRLWPRSEKRHARRPGSLEDAPCPPAAVDAVSISGADLRHVLVSLVRRHGPVSLRELHGLVHRYGYVVESERPVQRLGDAAAYELRQGRLVRHGRGVYGPAGAPAVAGRSSGELPPDALLPEPLLPDEPLPWAPPDDDDERPVVDPTVAVDPERWSDQRWPAAAQMGSPFCPSPADPAARRAANELHVTFMATRRRLADLVADRLGPPPHHLRADSPRPTDDRPTATSESFGDDSSTNRRQRPEPKGWEWGEVAEDEVVEEWPDEPDEQGEGGGAPSG